MEKNPAVSRFWSMTAYRGRSGDACRYDEHPFTSPPRMAARSGHHTARLDEKAGIQTLERPYSIETNRPGGDWLSSAVSKDTS